MKEESDFQTYSKRYYENGSIKEVYGLPKNRFSDFTKILEINEQGDTIFPGKIRTIKPQIITRKDTAFGIKNASNKTVSILFNQSDFSKRNNPDFIWFDFDIFLGANISMQDTLLNLYFPFTKLLISISPNNTYLSYDLGANLGDSIHVSTFQRYNMSPKKGNVSSYGIGNNKIRADFRSFYAIINGSTGGCPDSGENPTNLYFKGRKVSFSEIDNLQIIECDLNKDGRNEIYIMSSVACQSCIRLFKIE